MSFILFRRAGGAVALIASMLAAPAFAVDYVQAPGSSLAFATKYQGEVFIGRLPGFVTTMRFDPKRLADAKLDVTIPLAQATVEHPDGTDALRGSDFFDAARHPQARYTATRFRALGSNRYAADGTLSLRGASKPVTLEFTWTPGAKPVLTGRATVPRLAFGVGGGDWADTDLIPNDVAISTRVNLAAAR
ncbi:YceI family protein [Cognatilysobacter bugurensis]|uniref:Polyisoprenoid-binding protein n=1 Tax=Cognatilysobacter bugurensis TaxID=543356 RepID=A0A918T0X7_9GAMM|nr:YceI family protein [Lysobacter bugurensis]GHA77633.1 polyisoprenoid-binding protein [Lysobacter bugurensis]